MTYKNRTFEQQLNDNIKNYKLEQLIDVNLVREVIENACSLTDTKVLITKRHGEKVISYGDFLGFIPDVVNEPGIKIRVLGRTLGHCYFEGESNKLIQKILVMIEEWAKEAYLNKETSIYLDQLKVEFGKTATIRVNTEKIDALTGVYHKAYFKSRMSIIERSQVAPIAAICININDWMVVNNLYGHEESDRLIKVIAQIIQENAKAEYCIGRVDGDVFYVLISVPEDGEVEAYIESIRTKCNNFEDDKIAPSVAIGYEIKKNVQELLEDVFSEAEYKMFEDKLNIKASDAYKKRIEKIKKQ